MTTDERIEDLEKGLASARRLGRWLPTCAAVCLGLIFTWVFFAQPGPLGTAQAEGPANPYEAENTKLLAEFNLLKRENERLRKELDEAKKDKTAAAPTDAQGQPASQPANAQAQAVDETAKVIRANSFILKDENDKVRAVLSMEAGGRRLGLFNAAGKKLAFLEVTEKTGPVLTFIDAAGRQVWSTANATPSPASEVPSKGGPMAPAPPGPVAPAPAEPRQCPTCNGTGVLGQCPYCEGTGHELWPSSLSDGRSPAERVMPRKCDRCGGTGMKPCFRCGGPPQPATMQCPKCKGTGIIGNAGAGQKLCYYCQGTGKVKLPPQPLQPRR